MAEQREVRSLDADPCRELIAKPRLFAYGPTGASSAYPSYDPSNRGPDRTAYSMMHFGHANALRQCKVLLGADQLVVGVHSDKEILAHKGPPVMNEEERSVPGSSVVVGCF